MTKKSMITAASVAMVGGAFAGAVPQVYDMTLTLKASECKMAKKAVTAVCGDEVLVYRAQATKKFQGMFWGCECATIACNNYFTGIENDGYIFWNTAKNSGAFHNANFEWNLLNVIGQKATDIEGDWNLTLENCDGEEVASLRGAGFGTIKNNCSEDNYIKSMSGKVVGYFNVVNGAIQYGCKYCSDESSCITWDFCDCLPGDDTLAAAFGDWTLKYNSSLSKKLAQGKYINEAYKFPAWVLEEMECIAAAEPDPTPSDKVTENYKNAEKALAAAQSALDAAEADFIAKQAAVNALDAKTYAEVNADGLLEEQLILWEDKVNFKSNGDVKDEAIEALAKAYNDLYSPAKAYTSWKGAAGAFATDNKISDADVLKYAAALFTAMEKYYGAANTYALESSDIEWKQILEKDRTVEAKALDDAKKAMTDAETNFRTQVGKMSDVVASQKILDSFAALKAFAEGSEAVTVPYNVAEQEWGYASLYNKADGKDLPADAKKNAEKACAAAETVRNDAMSARGDAQTDFAAAQLACLITKGTKDCQ